jgi:hypothetical protein
LPFQIFVGHLSWLKTQMALMHWDYIDRLGNSIRTAIQENIYDDNIHFIKQKQRFVESARQPDYSYWLTL